MSKPPSNLTGTEPRKLVFETVPDPGEPALGSFLVIVCVLALVYIYMCISCLIFVVVFVWDFKFNFDFGFFFFYFASSEVGMSERKY